MRSHFTNRKVMWKIPTLSDIVKSYKQKGENNMKVANYRNVKETHKLLSDPRVFSGDHNMISLSDALVITMVSKKQKEFETRDELMRKVIEMEKEKQDTIAQITDRKRQEGLTVKMMDRNLFIIESRNRVKSLTEQLRELKITLLNYAV